MTLKLKKKSSSKERFTLPIDQVEPNPWNMNQMDPLDYEKLKAWVAESLETEGKLALPIVVRRKKNKNGYQIIDGYHRWKACVELGQQVLDCYVYDADDKAAKFLTNSLNYLRGSPNPTKEIDYIRDLVSDGVTVSDIAQHTSYTQETLEEMITQNDIKIEEVTGLDAPSDDEEEKQPENWVEMKFTVPVAAAEVIEAEIARIADKLDGKQVRGRALEYMAVLSGQSSLAAVGDSKKKLSLNGLKRRKTLHVS